MKRKINICFVIIATLAIVMTLFLSVVVFYKVFQTEVLESLETYAHLLEDTEAFANEEGIADNIDYGEFRITMLDKDGDVYYDTSAKAAKMDNHIERPEVAMAVREGTGSAIRKSRTMNRNTFYYAILLEDGNVLRVAKETDGIYQIFADAFPVIGIFLVIVFCLCLAWSHFLTKSVIEPIRQMADDVDGLESIVAYKELVPFIHTIREQHEDILKNARLRQEFTANVSHELKTPLTAISGYAELISNGMASDKDVARFAGEIHHNAKRLLTLINDIIRLSELDESGTARTIENVNLYVLAQNCVDMLEIPAKRHDVKVKLYGSSCNVLADKQMMEEILYNLCDNAIRYNKPGGMVEVRVERDHLDRVVLTVKDTGIGIPEEHKERIFERFYRVDKSRSKSTGGTGLGLAIVKHIVETQQAEMEIESEVGKGTKITVTF